MPSFAKVTSPLRRWRRPAGWLRWFVHPPGRSGWRKLRWGRIGGLGSAILLGGYATATTLAYVYARFERGISTVRYLDVALPNRWRHVRTKLGEHQLAQAATFRDAGRYAEALIFARAGLARAPANREGRLLAAQLLRSAGRLTDADRNLLDGLAYHPLDPELLAALLQGLWQQQKDRAIVGLARRLVPGAANAPEAQHLLLTAGAASSLARGNFDDAEDFVRASSAFAASKSGRHLEARIDWERGLRALALVRLRQLAVEFPADPAVQRDLCDWLRTSGHADEARRVVLSLQLATPHRPEPRLELIRDHHASGEAARRDREVASYLAEFAADAGAWLALADFAASAGQATLAAQLAQHARDRAWEATPFDLLVIEAFISARHYAQALESVRQLRAALPAPPAPLEATLNGLLAIAHQGLGDVAASRTFLAALMHAPHIRSATLLSVARRLDELGAADSARMLLRRVTELDPLDQSALSRLIEIELATHRFDEIHTHVRRLLAMRRPSPDLLLALRHALSGDRFLFSADAAETLAALASATRPTALR